MAYIRKIIGHDEQLIGIARLHWIYVLKGIAWFVVLAGAGWLLNTLIQRVALSMADATDSAALPYALMTISNGAMYFLMFGGALIFFFFTLKVLVTEIGLSSRRVMHKEGLIFIKVKQIDLEEIRGESLDLGYFGRMLGYGYLLLDCRFIGDVRLPAIEKPERFLKALHESRAKTQDSLSVVLGKGNPAPIQVSVPPEMQQPEAPQPAAPQPAPEIQPPQPGPEINPPSTPRPEIAPTPVPHGPPPGQPSPQTTPQPEVTPQPQQPVPAPGPDPQPPLQPPAGRNAAPLPSAAEDIPQAAAAAPSGPQTAYPASPAAPQVQQPPVIVQNTVDPKVVQQVVQQALPQMAQQVAQELVNKGLVENPHAQNDNDIDTDLIDSFDDAAHDKDGPHHDPHHRLEHSIH